ncbi:COPI associated protein [Gregarina niphandrodes]|uniref:COPI associated protein n=1 Tax=Gregarina niphandrodes TaxID=110365 RepID=A0A023AYN6_GRENI|nr:COPI associated protein [Gregarina niphandrodes]EZG43777.1 COPI associated protein [Gregarina niphandrodes]|eukprot:XP_011134613.1 COPI associated protein [Gregarina niphandrodes]
MNKNDWNAVLRDRPAFDVKGMREELEGPAPIRAFAALGGVAMCLASALGMLNVIKVVFNPVAYLLHLYLIAFGMSVIAIEGKTLGENSWKMFVYRWLPFTTVVGGKGLMYAFFGLLGLAYGFQDFLLFAAGCYMVAVGVVYCLIHTAKFESLNEKYAKSQYVTRSSMYY